MAGPTLRKELKLWGALALSIGLMAPTLAMGLNGQLPASRVGAAVPLVFLLGLAGVGFVAYGFVRLTRHFNHAGSVYALAGATLGPRAGFFAGFALLGVYFAFAVCTLAATADFFQNLLAQLGYTGHVPWILISLVATALIWALNARDVRVAARALLSLEGLGIALTVVLVVVIFARVGTGHAPGHRTLDLAATLRPKGVGFGTVIAATVFAFLSWAGFEAAAALGEETSEPRRNIPRSLIGAVVLTGVFYVMTMFAQTIGFGTDAAGVKAFAGSSGTLGDLAKMYVGGAMATLVMIAAVASAFGSALGSVAAASRILFALSRDGFGSPAFARISPRTGTPMTSMTFILGASIAVDVAMALKGTDVTNVYFYYATLGVLCILVAYAMANVGAIRFILAGRVQVPKWEMIVPAIGTVYLGYVFYEQSAGQVAPYSWFPYVAALWCLAGLAVVAVRPSLARQIGGNLTQELTEPGGDGSAEALEPTA